MAVTAAPDGSPPSRRRPTSAARPQGGTPPEWVSLLPGVAFVSAAAFLAGGTLLGVRLGMRRGAREAEAAGGDSVSRVSAAGGPGSLRASSSPVVEPPLLHPTDARSVYRMPLPNAAGMTVGQLAGKALLYGTALCLGGSTLLGLGVCWVLDTWSADAFSRRMEVLVPVARTALEGALQAPLSAITSSSKSFAGGVKGTVGVAIATHVPKITGISREEEAAGLTKRDKALLEDFRAMFEDDEREGEGREGGGAGGPTGPAPSTTPTPHQVPAREVR